MSQINLYSYIEEIKQHFISGDYAQVVAHSRQILKTYPRYVEAYRLMGYALAEQKAFQEAENVLYRVLSIDISDFEAHRYLAEGFASTGQLEKAIWHIEHAFEIDPNHLEVTKLREQYYRRATVPAPVVNGMSLASVARLYVKGGIYDQAIEELNRMLAHNPDRLDWRTLLAVAYWREGKNTEALKLGESILEKLPNNYYARMVMGDIWRQNGRLDIADSHLDILQQILLIDYEHRASFPLAAPILEQSEKISTGFSVTRLPADASEGWSSPTWESDADSIEDADETEFDDVLSSLELADDDAPTKKMAPVTPEIEYDRDALGTGSLDSFTNPEALETEGGAIDESEAELILPASEEPFSWDGGDDPDPLTDSELNQLPDIDNLMTAELDYGVDADDPTVESITEELNALSVNSIEELAELDRQKRADTDSEDIEHILSEEDFNLSDEDFGLDDEFFIDLTLEDVLNEDADLEESTNQVDEPAESIEPADLDLGQEDALPVMNEQELEKFEDSSEMADPPISELVIEVDEDLAQALDEPPIEPEPLAESDQTVAKNDLDLNDDLPSWDSDNDALDWLDSDSDNELDDVFSDLELEEDLGVASEATTTDQITETIKAEAVPTVADFEDVGLDEVGLEDPGLDLETESGFTDWLEAVDAPEEEPQEPAKIEDQDLEALMLEAEGSDDPAGSELDGSTDAMHSGLFDFLSDDANQLNPLPSDTQDIVDQHNSDLEDEIDEPDWEIDFSNEDQGEDEEQLQELFEQTNDVAVENEEPLVQETSESAGDDPFDTSWLDLEQTEEIDLLSEPAPVEEAEDVDLRTYAENLESDFDLLAPDDPESAIDFSEESDPVYASIENLGKRIPEESDEAQAIESESETPELDSDVTSVEEPNVLELEDNDVQIGTDPEEIAVEPEEAQEVEQTSSLEWLIPGEEESELAGLDSSDEDLEWLSLLEDAGPETKDPNAEAPPKVPWTGDLSAAASAILMPEGQNSTEDSTVDEAPDWLNEFPEYNTGRLQTDKLVEENVIDNETHGTRKIQLEDDSFVEPASEDEKPDEDDFEDDQIFAPVVFQESSAMKLPDWLSDSTESASLGYEPEPGLKADLEAETDQPASDDLLDMSDDQIDLPLEDSNKSNDSELILEDELDMEFDKNGNPIPPESQELEDTLNWLEELATLDLEGDISKSAVNIKNLATDGAKEQQAKDESLNEDPLSDIFSGGSALHAFADLENESSEAVAENVDEPDVSKETLSWLDNLFAPARSPKTEEDAPEPVEPENEPEEVAAEAEVVSDSLEDELFIEDLEGLDPSDHDKVDEVVQDILGFAEEEPEDKVVEELDELDLELPALEVDELIEEEIEQISSSLAEPVEEPKSAASELDPSLDDLYISEEEISNAVEHGDEVPGMGDIPDDPEALMAWLNLEPESEPAVDTSITEAEAAIDSFSDELELESPELLEDLPSTPDTALLEAALDVEEIDGSTELESVADVVDEIVADGTAAIEETVATEDKKSSLFDDSEALTVSADEISNAVEFGDEVPGMGDIPDDPDALMEWLDLSPLESSDASVEEAIEMIESAESSEADLIIADLGSDDSEPLLEAKGTTDELNLEKLVVGEELDDLFNDLAGPEGADIEDEDLIFGDLGTGRLSGTDWLDKMTFDSDPALLGDVPTVLPTAPTLPDEEDLEALTEDQETPAETDTPALDTDISDEEIAESAAAEVDQIESIEDLPDDPDEFMRILESNVPPTEASVDLLDEEQADGSIEIPDWLQVEADETADPLNWLDEASPSGVMNWLEAEESAKTQDASASEDSPVETEPVAAEAAPAVETVESEVEKAVEDSERSMFDDVDQTDSAQDSEASIDDLQKMLDSRDDLPGLIRKIRDQLKVRNDPALQKLLGDAYMESGQLQDALDAYRQAQRLL